MNAMKRIIYILKDPFMTPNKLTHLGRWKINNDIETILKIKYANEDNCGISGNISKKQNNVLNHNHYIYMMGYESMPK